MPFFGAGGNTSISLYLFELYMTYDVTVNRVASLYRSKLADKTNVNMQHEFLFN